MSSDAAPPQPQAILRGHKVQVHAASFVRSNDRLATGDADGFVVLWDLAIMRPRAVWQAHTNAILGISAWGDERIITHGRDSKLIVWKLGVGDEESMSTSLPLDRSAGSRPQPWMMHLLEVNTMNFCTFASCPSNLPQEPPSDNLLIAVPNTLASEAVDIFHLPSQLRQHTIKLGNKNGMVMALSICHQNDKLTIIAGYENGVAILAQLDDHGSWTVKYQAQSHSQPILSLDIDPRLEYFITAGADAVIAKHPMPEQPIPPNRSVKDNKETEVVESLSSQHMSSESENGSINVSAPKKPVSLLSAALAAQSPQAPSSMQEHAEPQTQPLKLVNTKHAGQQGLRVRPDGRVFATAGWDAKIRVYSTKTLREVAVLRWHQVGCYTTAFSNLNIANSPDMVTKSKAASSETTGAVVPKLLDITVKERRIRQASAAHWLAAGSKDGKVSLWDIF